MVSTQIRIEISKMPEIELKIFCKSIIKAVTQYFENPDHEAEFQKWLKNRNRGGETKCT